MSLDKCPPGRPDRTKIPLPAFDPDAVFWNWSSCRFGIGNELLIYVMKARPLYFALLPCLRSLERVPVSPQSAL